MNLKKISINYKGVISQLTLKRWKFSFTDKFFLFFLFNVLLNLIIFDYSFAKGGNDTTLIFLGNKNIAPIIYLTDSTPSGVAIDIVHTLAKYIPYSIKIKAMDWQEAQTLVAKGEADALIQINQTEERKKIYDFSDPLLESQFSIFVHSDKVGISGISRLRGLQVGVESGGLPRQLLEKNPLISLTIIPNFLEGFNMLNQGTLDAVVVDYRVGSYIIAENNIRDIKVSGEPIAFSYSSFAVKKGNTKLLDAINHALRIIKSDGTYQYIIDKWKPKEVVFYTREQITQMIYTFAIPALLLLLLIAVIWMITLKKQLNKRKTAEENLKKQYSTLRGIIDSTDALIFSLDKNYRYTSFNSGHALIMKTIYGSEIELGHSILDYMTVLEDKEIAKHNINRALNGEQIVEESYSGEEILSRKYFHVSHSPINSEGEIIGVTVLAQDMTSRKQSEEQISRLNRVYAVLSNINQTIVRVHGTQELFNDACRIAVEYGKFRMVWIGMLNFQTDKVEVIASYGISEDDFEKINIELKYDLQNNGPVGIAVKTGHYKICNNIIQVDKMIPWRESASIYGYKSCASFPIIVFEKVIGVFTIYSEETDFFFEEDIKLLNEMVKDISFALEYMKTETERNQAHEELLESNRKLENALVKLKETQRQVLQQEKMRSLGQLASGIAHDINNSLTPILGYMDMLTDDEEVMKNYENDINMIIKSIKNVSRTIERMREFYKVKMMDEILVEKNVNDIINISIELTKHKWKDIAESIGSIIEIKREFEDNLPLIKVDDSEIIEALTNIILNACDAMPDGGVLTFKTYQNENNIVIQINDTGCGMKEETLNQCMDPFFTTKGEKGTGLGLSMVYGIIERHKGQIKMESEPNKGTNISLILPIVKEIKEEARKKELQKLMRPLKILNMDDDVIINEMLKKMLEKKGHKVMQSNDGKAGLELYKKSLDENEPFDLVITDLGMPGLDGISISKEIKRMTPDIPVILLTGWGSLIMEQEHPTINYLLKKPIMRKDLFKAIDEIFRKET